MRAGLFHSSPYVADASGDAVRESRSPASVRGLRSRCAISRPRTRRSNRQDIWRKVGHPLVSMKNPWRCARHARASHATRVRARQGHEDRRARPIGPPGFDPRRIVHKGEGPSSGIIAPGTRCCRKWSRRVSASPWLGFVYEKQPSDMRPFAKPRIRARNLVKHLQSRRCAAGRKG